MHLSKINLKLENIQSVAILYLVFVVHYLEATQFRCDYSHSMKAQAWFKLHQTPVSWSDAKQICLDEGSEIALPKTWNLREEMMSLMNSSQIPLVHTDLKILITPEHTVDFALKGEMYALSWTGLFEKKMETELLPFICSKLDSTLGKCGDNDEYIYDNRTDHCYKFHRLRLSWKSARLICTKEGGSLAIINDEEEAQVIKDIFAMNRADSIPGMDWKDSAFLGFYMYKNGKWKTVDGTPLFRSGYEKWSEGEPNNSNGNEFCGSVGRNGLLFDDPCARALPFICEKETKRVTCLENENVEENNEITDLRSYKETVVCVIR